MADHEVVVVGGGPAGATVAVFAARRGLDTVVYDRGRSSIARCAHLENYPGFPAGIDVETLYGLLSDHVESAGARIVEDMVESVDRRGTNAGFDVTLQEGDPVTARRVVAATRYDADYLHGLDDDDAILNSFEHDGEERERFDREYPDADGTTPVEGLYVASPSEEADMQAVAVAGRGARVARRVVADARIDDGWWEEPALGVDWLRREASLDGDWADRDRWVAWFDDHYGPDAPVDTDTERFRRVREAAVDESLAAFIDDDEIDARAAEGHRVLAGHLDPARIVEAHGATDLLDAVDDDAIRAYLDEDAGRAEAAGNDTPSGD